jgi:hypothetical protein
VLDAARVLARHLFDRTLVFALFDQEEVRRNGWGRGGEFFANTARREHEAITGVLILDQMAYNPYGHDVATIGPPDTRPGSPSAAVAHAVAAAYRQYTDLHVVYSAGQNGTDAYRLYQAGFPGASTEEAEDRHGNPLNPFFETPKDYYLDRAGNLHMYKGFVYTDLAYTTEITRGGVAWAVEPAGQVGGAAVAAHGDAVRPTATARGPESAPGRGTILQSHLGADIVLQDVITDDRGPGDASHTAVHRSRHESDWCGWADEQPPEDQVLAIDAVRRPDRRLGVRAAVKGQRSSRKGRKDSSDVFAGGWHVRRVMIDRSALAVESS